MSFFRNPFSKKSRKGSKIAEIPPFNNDKRASRPESPPREQHIGYAVPMPAPGPRQTTPQVLDNRQAPRPPANTEGARITAPGSNQRARNAPRPPPLPSRVQNARMWTPGPPPTTQTVSGARGVVSNYTDNRQSYVAAIQEGSSGSQSPDPESSEDGSPILSQTPKPGTMRISDDQKSPSPPSGLLMNDPYGHHHNPAPEFRNHSHRGVGPLILDPYNHPQVRQRQPSVPQSSSYHRAQRTQTWTEEMVEFIVQDRARERQHMTERLHHPQVQLDPPLIYESPARSGTTPTGPALAYPVPYVALGGSSSRQRRRAQEQRVRELFEREKAERERLEREDPSQLVHFNPPPIPASVTRRLGLQVESTPPSILHGGRLRRGGLRNRAASETVNSLSRTNSFPRPSAAELPPGPPLQRRGGVQDLLTRSSRFNRPQNG
ncbi:hypothetical protein BDZ45DRAFT_769178 [Acephala macrosclerotiorum]|nr:hypothetical protein BDZ45DRAFT_769178 [Acephala macrosclerotiorum]